MSSKSTGPLQGIVVLDLTHAMAGPFATQKLGDLGADVIKVEPPRGDFTRWQSIANAFVGDQTTGFLSMNRNKRSITLDLKAPEGLAVVQKLAARADVVLQNFRPAVAQRLKIDYDSLKQMRPDLIYCTISGYGDDGPWRDRPGQDLVVQGYSGCVWNIGSEDMDPLANGIIVVDPTASHLAVEGILAAVVHRLRTGEGQRIEISMLEGLLDLQVQEVTTYLNTGIVPKRTREPLAHPSINGPYGIFRTKDGYVTVAQTPPHVLGEALDNDELRAMTDWTDGMTHRDRMFQIVRATLPARTTAEWLARFAEYNVWSGPVLTLDEVMNSDQVQSRGYVREVEHPTVGSIRLPALPIRFSRTPAQIRMAPPLLGQHSAEILAWLGYSDAEIAALKARGISGAPAEGGAGH